MAMRGIVRKFTPTSSMESIRGATRRFSDGKGKILSEEERAAENVYIKKMEKERLEKLKQKLEKEKGSAKTTDDAVNKYHLPSAGYNITYIHSITCISWTRLLSICSTRKEGENIWVNFHIPHLRKGKDGPIFMSSWKQLLTNHHPVHLLTSFLQNSAHLFLHVSRKTRRIEKSAQELMAQPFINMYDDLEVDLASYFTNTGAPLATF